MAKVILSVEHVNPQNAHDLSEKVGVSTVNAKGTTRSNGEQSKALKREIKKADEAGSPLSYNVKTGPKTSAGMGEIFSRKGKKTKSQEVREILTKAGEDFDRDKMLDKLCKKFNWSRDLAARYMVDNYRRVYAGAECYDQVAA